jgi:hypothetical protein
MTTRMMLDNSEHSLIQLQNAIPKLNLTLHKNIYVCAYVYGTQLNKIEHTYEEVNLVEEYLCDLLWYIRGSLNVSDSIPIYTMEREFENEDYYRWKINNANEVFIDRTQKFKTAVNVNDFHGTLEFYFEVVYSWK